MALSFTSSSNANITINDTEDGTNIHIRLPASKAIKRGAVAPNPNTATNHAGDMASLRVEVDSLKALLGKRINELEEANTKADTPFLVGPSSAAIRENINLHSHPSPSRICRRLPPIPGPTPRLVTTDDNDFPVQSGRFPSLHAHISHLDENQAGILPCRTGEADFGIFPPTRPQIGESSCGVATLPARVVRQKFRASVRDLVERRDSSPSAPNFITGPTTDAGILTDNACIVGAVACDTVSDDYRQIEQRDDALSAVSKNVMNRSILCATTGMSLQMSDNTTPERVQNRTISEEATADNKPKRKIGSGGYTSRPASAERSVLNRQNALQNATTSNTIQSEKVALRSTKDNVIICEKNSHIRSEDLILPADHNSFAQHKMMEKQWASVRTTNADLKAENALLKKKNDVLRKERDVMRNKVQVLKREVEEMKARQHAVQTRSETMDPSIGMESRMPKKRRVEDSIASASVVRVTQNLGWINQDEIRDYSKTGHYQGIFA